jgi:hypothetical protein
MIPPNFLDEADQFSINNNLPPSTPIHPFARVSLALFSRLATAVVAALDGVFGYTPGNGGAVTQITSASTAVVLNTACGQITTVALTTAAAAEETFTLTNSKITAKDIIAVSTTYDGAGTPAVSVRAVADGSCKIVITNLHGSNALNALMVINFAVLKGQSA